MYRRKTFFSLNVVDFTHYLSLLKVHYYILGVEKRKLDAAHSFYTCVTQQFINLLVNNYLAI